MTGVVAVSTNPAVDRSLPAGTAPDLHARLLAAGPVVNAAAATDKPRHLHSGRVDRAAVARLLPTVTRRRIG